MIFLMIFLAFCTLLQTFAVLYTGAWAYRILKDRTGQEAFFPRVRIRKKRGRLEMILENWRVRRTVRELERYDGADKEGAQ